MRKLLITAEKGVFNKGVGAHPEKKGKVSFRQGRKKRDQPQKGKRREEREGVHGYRF